MIETTIHLVKFLPISHVTKSGQGVITPCPFHDEKTGSFLVNVDSKGYICLSCKQEGEFKDVKKMKDGRTLMVTYK